MFKNKMIIKTQKRKKKLISVYIFVSKVPHSLNNESERQ